MDKILDKLSQYNFLTNILPGTVLCMLLKYLLVIDIIPEDKYQAGIVFYFTGMVNNRTGSLIVEPLLKYLRFIKFAPYKDFVKSETNDPKITLLSQENNIFRSYIAVSVILIMCNLYLKFEALFCSVWLNDKNIMILSIFVIFLFSYRKQTTYIRKRVDYYAKLTKS